MAKNLFSIRGRRGNPPSTLSHANGQWLARVQDEDGTDVYRASFPTQDEALGAACDAAALLRALREKHLGVASLEQLKAEYRRAKAEADAARDRFAAAVEKMRGEEYRQLRATIASAVEVNRAIHS